MGFWDKWKKKIQTVVGNVKSKVESWFSNAKAKQTSTTPTTTQNTPTDSTNAATNTELKQITSNVTPKTDNTDKTVKPAVTTVTPTPTPTVKPATSTPTQTTITPTPATPTPAQTTPAQTVTEQTNPVAPTPTTTPQPIAPAVTPEEINPVVNEPVVKPAAEPQKEIAPAAVETTPEAPAEEATGGDRFLQWYKEKFGKEYSEGNFTKPEDMSDKEYETGNNLFQAYLQKQNLENQYNSANKQIEDSKAQQRQEASIIRDKMAKYLQVQNKNNGLDNLGVSESTNLQADAQYMNSLGSIEANANNEKTSLLNNYLNNKTNVDTAAAENEQNILSKYQQYAREDEQKEYDRQQDEYSKKKYEEEQNYKKQQDEYERKKYEEELAYQKQQDEYNKQKAIQDAAYNEFMATVESGTFNTAAELEEFYNSFKDKLSPEQQAIAEQQVKFYKNNPDQKEIDNETEEAQKQENAADILSGKKYINYKGQDYQINSGALAQDSAEMKYMYGAVSRLFGTNNPYGDSIPDGASVSLGEVYRQNAIAQMGEETYNKWKDNPIIGPDRIAKKLEEEGKQLTYYDGNWYYSQKR